MEEDLEGKSKRMSDPYIPANYVSILQLKERWLKQKNLKRKGEEKKKEEEKEEDEEKRLREQQVEEQGNIEEGLKKSVAIGKHEDLCEDSERNRYEEKRFRWKGRNPRRRYSTKNVSMEGREANCAKKDEPEVMAIVNEGSKDADPRDERLPESIKKQQKRKKKRKKTINQATAVEDVVDFESSAPPESLRAESTPVKKAIRDYRSKRENATGKKIIGSGEKASTDVTALEIQLEDLSINRGEEREQARYMNAHFRSSHGRRNWPGHRHDFPLHRGRMPRGAAPTLVWVKKEHNEGAGSGSGNGVKPLTS